MDCLRLWDLVKRIAESQAGVSGELVECHQAGLPSQGTFKAVRLAQCFWRPYKKEKVTSSMPAAANMPIDAGVSCPSVLQCVSFREVIFEFRRSNICSTEEGMSVETKQNTNNTFLLLRELKQLSRSMCRPSSVYIPIAFKY